MRRLFLLTSIVTSIIAPDSLAAQDAGIAVPRFAEIAWGTSEAEVRRIVPTKGYKFLKTTEAPDLWYSSTYRGVEVNVAMMFSPQRNW